MDFNFSKNEYTSQKNSIFYDIKSESDDLNDPFPSIFDNKDKLDLKDYNAFKKISSLKNLSLDTKNKLFENYLILINDKQGIQPFEKQLFQIYRHKNYKAILILYEVFIFVLIF